jgi:hypothetical protein
LAGLVMVAGVVLASCTTFVEPTTCQRNSTSCGGIDDARFCEYVADAVRGMDCAELGLAPSRPFCVVTFGSCIETSYAVKDRDCKVIRYETVRDSTRADCSPGTPMFVNQ